MIKKYVNSKHEDHLTCSICESKFSSADYLLAHGRSLAYATVRNSSGQIRFLGKYSILVFPYSICSSSTLFVYNIFFFKFCKSWYVIHIWELEIYGHKKCLYQTFLGPFFVFSCLFDTVLNVIKCNIHAYY